MSKNFLKGFTTIKLVIVTAICIILFMIIIPVITMKADVKIDFNKYATNKEKINVNESDKSEDNKVEEEVGKVCHELFGLRFLTKVADLLCRLI